ncbi:MAG: hypothetical protein RR241_02820, partial [Raoultibacter sp.]
AIRSPLLLRSAVCEYAGSVSLCVRCAVAAARGEAKGFLCRLKMMRCRVKQLKRKDGGYYLVKFYLDLTQKGFNALK